MTIHNVVSMIFLLATLSHIILNWRPVLGYVRDKTTICFTFKQECILAFSIVTVLIVIIGSHVFHIH